MLLALWTYCSLPEKPFTPFVSWLTPSHPQLSSQTLPLLTTRPAWNPLVSLLSLSLYFFSLCLGWGVLNGKVACYSSSHPQVPLETLGNEQMKERGTSQHLPHAHSLFRRLTPGLSCPHNRVTSTHAPLPRRDVSSPLPDKLSFLPLHSPLLSLSPGLLFSWTLFLSPSLYFISLSFSCQISNKHQKFADPNLLDHVVVGVLGGSGSRGGCDMLSGHRTMVLLHLFSSTRPPS